jgi:hypothetical protein
MVYYPLDNSQEQKNLSIGIMSKADLGEDTDKVIEALIEKFQDTIDAERFSAKPNVDGRSVNWTEFSEDDIQFIKDSFKSL